MDEMTSSFRALYRKAASAVTDLSSDAGTNRIPDKAQHLGDWIRSWGSDEEPLSARSVRVLVQPGWAVKKYHGQQSRIPADASPFDLIVNITGIGVVDRELSAVSRTQRALILVAKRFASLPRMPIVEGTTSLPPLADTGSSRGILSSELAFKDLTKLKHAHSNLDSRLQPFWSSSAPEQVLGLRIKTRTNGAGHGSVSSADSANILVNTTVTTDSQGHFVKSLVIPWTKLCTDPASVPYIFKQHCGTASTHDVQNWELDIQIKAVDSLMEDEPSLIDEPPASAPSSTEATYYMHVAETAGIRVISDLDDTIKHSDILAGPREVFRNVFCRPLEDVAVPGMNSLYQNLATCGVSGFHYVSNSPLELLSTINDFLRLHAFPPPVSLRLKLYGGRSLVASLFDSPGDRKRQVVNNIFDSFPDSKFILIGDSGEQDLELYASLAIDRPRRVLAVIIRDVTSCRALELRQLPLTARRTPSRQSSASSVQSFESIRGSGLGNPVNSRGQDGQDADSFSTALHEMQDLTSAQEKILKRAAHWDERVLLAQHKIPGHIPLIFFEHTFEVEEQIVQLARVGLNIT